MPIQVTNKDISTRGITTANLSDFSGRDRQVVIHIGDPKGYRPIIMDGTTVGGKTKVALLDDLSDYVPESTYNSDKAGFETTAHATATYATKTELTSGLAGKADSTALANYATKSELEGKADSSALANYATKSELEGKADSSALASYATKTELNSYATLAAPALTGNATLDGSPIATEADIPVLTSSTTDLEAGTSPLATGTYYFVYE